MRLYNHIPVRFKDGESGLTPDQRLEIISYLKSGGAIVAFPESTRSVDGSLLPFRKGIFKMAAEANTPIIPVQIFGAANIFPRKAPLLSIRSGEIFVKVGEETQIHHQNWQETSRKIEEQYKINFQNQSNHSRGSAQLV
jgi:1-acyl-sn-glycerol-3-phosphate acyltransferase